MSLYFPGFFFTVVVAEALDPKVSSDSSASFLITVPGGVPAFTVTQNWLTWVSSGAIVPVRSMLFVAAL